MLRTLPAVLKPILHVPVGAQLWFQEVANETYRCHDLAGTDLCRSILPGEIPTATMHPRCKLEIKRKPLVVLFLFPQISSPLVP